MKEKQDRNFILVVVLVVVCAGVFLYSRFGKGSSSALIKQYNGIVATIGVSVVEPEFADHFGADYPGFVKYFHPEPLSNKNFISSEHSLQFSGEMEFVDDNVPESYSQRHAAHKTAMAILRIIEDSRVFGNIRQVADGGNVAAILGDRGWLAINCVFRKSSKGFFLKYEGVIFVEEERE